MSVDVYAGNGNERVNLRVEFDRSVEIIGASEIVFLNWARAEAEALIAEVNAGNKVPFKLEIGGHGLTVAFVKGATIQGLAA